MAEFVEAYTYMLLYLPIYECCDVWYLPPEGAISFVVSSSPDDDGSSEAQIFALSDERRSLTLWVFEDRARLLSPFFYSLVRVAIEASLLRLFVRIDGRDGERRRRRSKIDTIQPSALFDESLGGLSLSPKWRTDPFKGLFSILSERGDRVSVQTFFFLFSGFSKACHHTKRVNIAYFIFALQGGKKG